jgi:hypothetical protein
MTRAGSPSRSHSSALRSPNEPSSSPLTRTITRRLIASDLGILLLYSSLTVVFTYPLAFRIGSALPGLPPDTLVYFWNLEWVRRSIFNLGVSPFFTYDMYYPSGISLYLQPLILGSDVLALPLQFAFGTLNAYMITMLAMFVLSGYAGYLLALELVRNRAAAFFAGFVLTFSPYHLSHLLYSHFDLMPLQWLPLFALALKKLFDRPSPKHFLLALIFLFWASITDWYYALYALIFFGIYTLYRLIRARTWRPLREGILLGVTSLALLSPLLLPMLNESAAYPVSFRGVEESDKFSADLLGFVIPSSHHPVWGAAVAPLAERLLGGPAERTLFLGYTTLGLVLLAVYFRRGRELFFWLITGLVFIIMALGPVLHIAGQSDLGPNGMRISLPYALLFQIPIVSSVFAVARSISRFGAMVTLACALVAAFGLKELMLRLPSRAAAGAGLIACTLVGVEFLVVPTTTTPAQAPQAIHTIAADPQDFATLDVPADFKTGAEAMYFWTIDGKPTMNGYHARMLPIPLFDGVPSMRPLLELPEPADILLEPDPTPAQLLNFFHVRYIVLHKQTTSADLTALTGRWIQRNFGRPSPLWDDPTVSVYQVPTTPSPPIIVAFAQGWDDAERFSDGTVWRWIQNDAHVLIYSRQAETVELHADAVSFANPRRARFLLNGDQSYGTLIPASEVKPIEIPKLALRAGLNELVIHSIEPPQSPAALGINNDPRFFTFAFSKFAIAEAPAP